MQSASLPFRPRVADLADPAAAGIVSQAAHGRSRMNRVLLLHAMSIGVSVALLSFCILAVLASQLSRDGFALATWLLAALSASVMAICATQLWRSWISAADAPAVIDRRAELDDRLTTLLSVGPEAERSRLWEFLLRENLRLRPRWAPRMLVPRIAPPSIWLFGFALLLSLYSVWQAPARLHREGASGLAGRPDPSAPPSSPEDAAPGEDGGATDGSTWSDLPQELRQAILGSTPSRAVQGSVPKRTAPVENEIPGAVSIVGRNMKSSGPVRSMPATPESLRMASAPPAGRSALPARNPDKPKEGAGATAPAAPAHGDAPKTLTPERGNSQSTRDKAQNKQQPSLTALGGAGSAGAGSGGDADGLFGEKQAVGASAGSFSLDLDALRGGDDGKDNGDGADHRADSALAPNQRVDDAIRRAQVPAEYEGIVQRLFNRSADDADRPPGTR